MILLGSAGLSLLCALLLTASIAGAQRRGDHATEAAARALRAFAWACVFVFWLGWCYWLGTR